MSGFDSTVALVYLACAVSFVLGLHLMNSPASARKGNRLSAAGMAVAIITTVVVLADDGVITGTGVVVLTVGLLARGLPGLVARTWLASLPFGAAALLLAPGDALTRTCWTFLVVEVAAWVGFLLLERRADRS